VDLSDTGTVYGDCQYRLLYSHERAEEDGADSAADVQHTGKNLLGWNVGRRPKVVVAFSDSVLYTMPRRKRQE
jgi:hypothetical protein